MTHRSTATATAPLSRLMASLVAGSLVLALAMLGATVAHADPGPSLTGSFMTTTPQKMLYASRFPGVGPYTGVLPTNAAVSEYLSTTPLVNLCLTDSAGKPVDATTPGLLAKVVPQLVRTTVVGARSTIDPTMLPLPVSDQAANPGCFRVPHAGSGTEDEGADVFSGYLNNDGIDGYRAGGGDVLLAHSNCGGASYSSPLRAARPPSPLRAPSHWSPRPRAAPRSSAGTCRPRCQQKPQPCSPLCSRPGPATETPRRSCAPPMRRVAAGSA